MANSVFTAGSGDPAEWAGKNYGTGRKLELVLVRKLETEWKLFEKGIQWTENCSGIT